MKNILLLSILIGLSNSIFSQLDARTKAAAFSHLSEINSGWEDLADCAPQNEISFLSDVDRISFHLQLVVDNLRAKSTQTFNQAQLEWRTNLLNVLEEYAEKKVFPTNTHHTKRTPYFIDEMNVYCAVGFLIKSSGRNDLALQVHDEYNYSYISEIRTHGISEWAEIHGFTMDELAWIQPGYQAPGQYLTVGSGTNDLVKSMCRDANSEKLYIVGDFSELGQGDLCGNVGYIENDIIYCLGGGLVGDLTDVFMLNDHVVCTGNIQNLGTSYSYAIFANNSWSFYNVPSREGMYARTGISGQGDFDLQIVIENDLGLNEHEIWNLSNGTWNHLATASGSVNSVAKSDTEISYAGMFTEFTAHAQAGDLIFTTENAIVNTIGTDVWTELSGQIAEEVHKVKWLNGNFFFAGRALGNMDSPTCSFSTIHADSVVAIYSGQIYTQGPSLDVTVHDFQSIGDSSVVLCGDFYAGWMYMGRGVVTLDYSDFATTVGAGFPLSASISQAVGSINFGTPLAVQVIESDYYVSGDLAALKNVVKYDDLLDMTSTVATEISIYPNPTHDNFFIRGSHELAGFELIDFSGNTVLKGTGDFVDVSSLSNGMYLMHASLVNGEILKAKLVKN